MSCLPSKEKLDSAPEDVSVNWEALVTLPFDEWERARGLPGLAKWIQHASNMTWSDSDERFSQPRYTIPLMRLLRLFSMESCYSLQRLQEEKEETERCAAAAHDAEEAIRAQAELLRRECRELRALMEQGERTQDETKEADLLPSLESATRKDRDARRVKEKLDRCTRELDSLRHENKELRHALQCSNLEKTHVLKDDAKFRLEYEHLASRHKRLMEKFKKTDEMLREFQRLERTKERDETDELHRLRQKVQNLQQENCNLIQSRDRAEELCETREAEALRDMTELQQLHRDLIDEEKQRVQSLTMELQRLRDDADTRVEEAVQGFQQKLKFLGEENTNLRRRLAERSSSKQHVQDEVTGGGGVPTENSFSDSLSLSLPSKLIFDPKIKSDRRTTEIFEIELERLQAENDRLSAELQQMEIRAEARDADNTKIQALLKEYERGDEGLCRLRNELTESSRSIQLLQDENAQLRERLGTMDDSLTFSAALQQLCIRIGVTQEEIDRLRPKNKFMFSELEVLREEVRTLKEEVEWLEKERRHWMNKVRLQPLLDTKLRLELGLSPEQLKKLDHVVDQMKSGKHIVDNGDSADDGEDYKEKYFQELQLRRKEREYFNDFVRHQIEEAVQEAFRKTNPGSASDATSVLRLLQERVNLITARSPLETSQEPQMDTAQLRVQLQSALQLLEQSELTIKDNAASQATLREQLTSVVAERDMLMNERDKYRSTIFETLGIASSSSPAVGQIDLMPANIMGSSSTPNIARDTPSPTVLTALQKNSLTCPPSFPAVSISRTFEEQLRVKDELIASLKNAIEVSRNDVMRHHAAETEALRQLAEACATQEDLRNQVSAIQQINEELSGKLEEREKTLEDLQEAMRCMDSGNTRELVQKIVVLRQREGKLLQRLRRVIDTQEEAVRSEQTMREYVNTTFKSLKEALENTSTGFVLPRSSGVVCVEEDVIDEVRQRLDGALRGKLLREDTAYLLQLRQVYRNMEHEEELYALRADLKNQRRRTEEMENKMTEQCVELEHLRALQKNTQDTCGADGSLAAKWETEATTWRQKCALYMKRLEDKEREVSGLEAELEDSRSELALLQEHLHKVDSYGDRCGNPNRAIQVMEDVHRAQPLSSAEEQVCPQQRPQEPVNRENAGNNVRQLECDVARLKSINLGLLHHSLDLQGEYKRLEIQLEAAKQELFLVRDAGDSQKVSDFVSSAIQQHAALRRQTELAVLRTKRTRMQLYATEANLRVAVNEATAYRLSAFRLYRTYVTQMVAVLEYIHSLHRSIKGAISPHRVEMMHQRFLGAVADVESIQTRQSTMAARLADSSGTINLLQQQLELHKKLETEEQTDALHTKLLASLSAVREKDVRLAELQEDHRYLQQKLKRTEMHTQQLTEELTRLELRNAGVGSFDEDMLQKLLQLKETVFAKVESPAVIMHSSETGLRELDDANTDAAIREYKETLDKQAKLTRECDSLKRRLDGEIAETCKIRAEAEVLREEMNRMKERLQYAQRQLEEERRKSEEREQRIIRSHEAQAEVTRRAAEHNNQCLRDMVHNKEACIQQLQDQLLVERRKYLEYQLEESVRMERMHDHLFKENNAMMERFREAIDGVAENYTYNTMTQGGLAGAGVAQPDGVAEQLALLTRETLRLKSELKEARATNILLEAQVNEHVSKTQKQLLQGSRHTDQQVLQGTLPAETSVFGIINDQNAIIESLRQRENSLTHEVQRYRKERDLLEQQLHEARQLVVEQGGVLKSVAVAGANTSTVEQELRLQLTFLESQLSEARTQLEEERQNVLRLQTDSNQWRSHLDALHEEVVKQQADLERAQHLVAMNESLNEDIRRVEEQNQKLITATNMLKQRLIEQAQHRDDASRKQQHELALAQRMGVIQLESTEQLKTVTERLSSIQRELEEKVRREEEALKKHEEAQKVAYDMHKQLQEREEEILRLKHALASSSTPLLVGPERREKGTQVLQTVQEGIQLTVDTNTTTACASLEAHHAKPEDRQKRQQPCSTPVLTSSSALISGGDESVLAKPQLAATLRRQLEKAQRDNTHEISLLRATVRRLENDLEETREQLRGERDTSRSLRAMVQNVRQELEAKELAITQKSATRQQRPMEHQQTETQTVMGVKKAHFSGSVAVPSAQLGTASNMRDKVEPQQEDNEQLKRQIENLKKRVTMFDDVASEAERYKKELADIRCQQLGSVDMTHIPSPLDIRSHKRIVIHLEGVIESLQRELSVNKETQVRNLQRRIDELMEENQRLAVELNRRYQFIPGMQSSVALLKSESVRDREVLERELLEKNSTILDLRFEREALQLKVGRLERHVEDILQVDSTNAKRTGVLKQRGRMEALESVVENMKVVVERLQHENDMLKRKTVSMSKHMDLVRELRELRVSERQLREHCEMLTKRLVGSASSGSVMSKQQARLYRRLQSAHATMEQYQAEMVELKQRLEVHQPTAEGGESAVLEEGRHEDAESWKDRRSVQPIDPWSSDLPPPLPSPPVTAVAGSSFSTGVCPH